MVDVPVRKFMDQGSDDLTSREYEVCALVAAGLSNKEIANKLIIRTSTVKTHIEHALGKCQARNRAQLAVKYKRTYNWLKAPY